ncbi:MAG TPA: protein kinase [Ktedonobacterales bacterium]|nr:protein kinase [Ktedonobacterales bacterium]
MTGSDERLDALRGQSLADRYQLGDIRAHGALSIVYNGTDVILQRPVAIKVTPLERASAYREALNATAALSYPAFLATYDVFEQDGLLYQAQEFIDGRPLSAYLVEGTPTRRAVSLALQLARALTYAHQHDLTHGDLTPSAILIDRNATAHINNVRLPADWEYFTETATSVERSGLSASAAGVLTALRDDERQRDVWSVAAALWFLLTHTESVGEDQTRIFHEDVTPEIRDVVTRTLDVAHERALTSAEELALALEQIDGVLTRGAARQRDTLPLAIRAFREERSAGAAGMATGLRRLVELPDERLAGASTYFGETDPIALDRSQTRPADDAPYLGYQSPLRYRPPAYQALADNNDNFNALRSKRARSLRDGALDAPLDPNPAWAMDYANRRDGSVMRPWAWTLIGIALFVAFFLIGYLMFPQLKLF